MVIVCAWDVPTAVNPAGVYPPEVFEDLRADAESFVKQAVARVAELQPQVACQGRAIEGQAAAV